MIELGGSVMERAQVKLTYEDYKNAPEGVRYELLEGELVLVPSPGTHHQRVLRRLGHLLTQYVEDHDRGEVFYAPYDVVLSPEIVLQPDILFVSEERRSTITDDNVRGAPDLVIEILSAATAERDRTYKRALYARYGVQEHWLVDPEMKTVELLRLGRRGFETAHTWRARESLRSPLPQGPMIPLGRIF
jgi:Uma2 family endonuclease